jgi:RHS repeat-associated protein
VVQENFSSLDLIGYTKIIEDISNSGAGGANAPVASLSASASWGKSTITRDMMDMNGDGYPDLLTSNQIQYTGVLGGLVNRTSPLDYRGHNSLSFADGLASGGNFVYAKNSNSAAAPSTKATRASSNTNVKQSRNANSAEQTSKSTLGMTFVPTGSLTTSSDSIFVTLLDINSDGLPDKISQDGSVQLNLGYTFANPENWLFHNIRSGKTFDYAFGGGGGLNYGNNSITAGLSFSKSENESSSALMDINGDGLPDLIKGYQYAALNPQGQLNFLNKSEVFFNTGSGFLGPVPWDTCFGMFDKGISLGGSVNSGFTVGVAFFIFGFPFKFCISPGGTYSQGLSNSTTQLSDISGDGMPDYLLSDNENNLKVHLSTLGRTNMLKTVHRPMGSNFTMDYLETPATFEHPGGTWALASVKSFDGLAGDGIDSSFITFEYDSGYYNRHERQFYGFASVKTHFHDTGNNDMIYRTLNQRFGNSDYYTKGMVLSQEIIDDKGQIQKRSENIYALRNIQTGELLPDNFIRSDSIPAFVALEEAKQYVFEGTSALKIASSAAYTYDIKGNITGYTDYSPENQNNAVEVSISYHSFDSCYLHSIPSKHEVTTQNGLMRKRETTLDKSGNIVQIKQLIAEDKYAESDMEYDAYGNLTKITRPLNHRLERMWYAYQYDDVVHSYITKITDAYGYISSSVYDYRWGMPIENIDKNNQSIRYTFDDCGRTNTVTGPYETVQGKPYTISFEYHPEATIPYAHTLHYDSVYNAIETYTFTDGTGRPVQIKKTASLFNDAFTEDSKGFIVSGKIVYDAFGRAIETYKPVFENLSNPTIYNAIPDNSNPVVTTYDALDRVLQVTLSDGSHTDYKYGIGSYNGEITYTDTIADALNHQSISYTNAKGQMVATVIKSSAGDITSSFEYNAIGELLSSTDPKNNKTLYTYDKMGRRTAIQHPDAGRTEFTYDAAGNIYKKITENLRKQIPVDGAINYHYDRERLVEIVYPRNVQNRVNYTYGIPGAAHNRAGRIQLVQDASGGQEFFYGPLGEVIKTIRTVQLGESDMRTWIWSAGYDTWNRLQYMTYPDGEKVTYSYNCAGNLLKMNGEKLGRNYDYISRIGYNKSEKQTYVQYGNGAVTNYNYEPERQRLAEMTVTSNNQGLMHNTYTYDVLDNILGITNNTEVTGDIGGSFSHVYAYDDLNRLTQASGIFKGNQDTSDYSLDMQYDGMGNIMHKSQTHNKNGEKQTATTYDFGYKYDGLKPNAASQIGEKIFTYDFNGNLTSWQDTVTNDYRQLSWDEENRLTLISDNGYLNRYVYDASDERVIKSHGGSQGVYINGAPAGIVNHSDNKYTIYVSPYFVLQNERFTKHYYTGGTRVTSKIGNGQFENQYRLGVFEITAGKINYIYRQQQILNDKKAFEEQADIAPGPPTMKGVYADPAYSGTAYTDGGTPDTITPRGWPKKPVFAPAGGPPGAPIQWGTEITNDNVEPGFGYVGNGNIEEDLRYFYHSDHLGSTGYITDAKGKITQCIAYMPFGETLAEQHSNWESPYQFNAKEIDVETGLYYYGSRYYDPKNGRWISADPLAENYPGLSPFAYCANNPVLFIDPDGEKIILSGTEHQKNLILRHLQKLTNDKLTINDKNEVVISGTATKNAGRKLASGTSLIRELNRSKSKTVEIRLSNDPLGSFEESKSRINASSGNGTNSTVNFSLHPDDTKVLTQDAKGKRAWEDTPPEIALGHELVHAYRSIKGLKSSMFSSDDNPYGDHDIEKDIPTEELETVGLKSEKGLKGFLRRLFNKNFSENKLRKEQGFNKRIRYTAEEKKK